MKKFGTILVSRPAGKEAWLAYQPVLNEMPKDKEVVVDFDGVIVLTPSWADEFLTPLLARFGNKVSLRNTDNPSVKATLAILAKP
ncbi:MAG: STAS-like domain-containing protein [Candidatus Gottesmanbacteria bacterium]|nr:STAS-like domain-containing protein [Candidatus Gottesmanbacteria bacterium]